MSNREEEKANASNTYWSKNLQRLGILLTLWFLGSYGVSILFVDELDEVSFFGFKLGFWFAQQGSIYIFLLLILVYVRTMNALDDEYEAKSRDENEEDA